MDKQMENKQGGLSPTALQEKYTALFYITLAIAGVATAVLSAMFFFLFLLLGINAGMVITFIIFLILIWAVCETGANHVRRQLLPKLAVAENTHRQIREEIKKMVLTFQDFIRERESFWLNIAKQYDQNAEEAEKYLNAGAAFVEFVASTHPEVLNEYLKFKTEQAEKNTPEDGGGNESN